MSLSLRIVIVFLVVVCVASAVCAAPAPLVLSKTVIIPGGPARSDFVSIDKANRRLLVAHTGANSITVLDLKTDTVLPAIKVGAVQGVAVDEAGGKYYAGDSKDQKVVVVDSKTLTPGAEIPLTGPVDDIIFNPKNHTVYADHDDGTEVWTIDSKTNKVTGSVTIAGPPEVIVYDRKTNLLYQNIKTTDQLQVIDPKTNKVTQTWPVAPAKSPHGLALDSKHGLLISAGGNGQLVLMDIKTGKVITSAPIVQGVDQIDLDVKTGMVYCAGRGAISVVKVTPTSLQPMGDVTTPKGLHTLSVDPVTHAVWGVYSDDKESYLLKFTAP
jgi:DNA-binding beta-propeller fold protein YncE